MGFNTAAGTSIAIGSASTYTGSNLVSTNGPTDSYTVIGQVTNIPEFGRKYTEVDFLPLATRGKLKVKGSYDEGSVEVDLARDTSDAGQIAVLVARDVDANYNFKITFNDGVAPVSATVTTPVASPGIVTDTGHGLAANTPVKFVVAPGSVLPGGIVSGTTYYVVTIDANTYNLSLTAGGSAFAFTGTSTGSHTRTTVPAGSYVLFSAQVGSFTSIVGTTDAVMMRKMSLLIQSGSSTETAKIPTA